MARAENTYIMFNNKITISKRGLELFKNVRVKMKFKNLTKSVVLYYLHIY